MDKSEIERRIAEHGIETVKIGTPDSTRVSGQAAIGEAILAGCDGEGRPVDVIFGWDIAEEVIDGPKLAIGTADTGLRRRCCGPIWRRSASCRGSPRARP
jgi:hypothetical protein